MKLKLAAAMLTAAWTLSAHALVEIQLWHSMPGPIGEWVKDLAKEFNASQSTYKVVPSVRSTNWHQCPARSLGTRQQLERNPVRLESEGGRGLDNVAPERYADASVRRWGPHETA